MIYAATSSLNQGILLFYSEIALRIHLIAFARERRKFIGTLLKTSETTRGHASALALLSSSSFLLSPPFPSSALKGSLSCFIPWVARTTSILSLPSRLSSTGCWPRENKKMYLVIWRCTIEKLRWIDGSTVNPKFLKG